ncbi:uncharacterized protein LOC129953387 isoform X2 [Eupeodes corollae]|uniref:uncharacterized protein LOC129953387 isoform X2 n=1 Tax=Eupeodes corollae TaxID=290404 RepID=UPI00249302A5|nr:uncharacterized protein LOC129953387 isoform X2 [Eupeodes corollae]
MNNAESKSSGQEDHEIAQHKSIFVHQNTDSKKTDEIHCQHETREQEHFNDEQSRQSNKSHPPVYDSDTRNASTNSATNSSTSRNKRKNFNPRPTAFDANSLMNLNSSRILNNNIVQSPKLPKPISPSSALSTIPPTTGSFADRGFFSESLDFSTVSQQLTQYHPWLQMFNQYEQLVNAAGLKGNQHQQITASSVTNGHHFRPNSASFSNFRTATKILEWADKFGKNESTETAIRDILKAYKENQHLDANSSVNIPTETEPPTPPTTPQTTCHFSSRSASANDNNDQVPHQSPVCESFQNYQETQNSSSLSPPPPQSNAEYTNSSENHNDWTTTISEQPSKKTECEVHEDDYLARSASGQSYHNEGSDYDRREGIEDLNEPSAHTNIRKWNEDFKKIDKSIKNEADDTIAVVDDDGDGDGYVENNIYDDDYPPSSPNYFLDSPNAVDDVRDDEDDDEDEDEDDDDNDSYRLNMLCDEDQSEADDQQLQHHPIEEAGVHFYSTEADSNIISNPDLVKDLHESNTQAEKDSTCSNSSSRISVRNLGGFYEQGQMNLIPSKLPTGIDEKNMHYFFQNMNKFTSYLECLNEMCRLENLREHYHCYDYPCFGKILSKKEEVIRHVKWHRKRMESLNNGFMRFSSSDDCSTTFGIHCQHNRKQTHYHCFQPNCDRVYISTSDVQMHSNFHRKDSAIHKEGFQRFRANEKCSADYCMFAGQKTTHFHCRRDNCCYTFKNKADMEKHKTYHIKDLKLARDGFKKFLKNEACPYKQCKFSKVCNHIHCARENCFYVLHSSGQLLSHKRKHERIDNEQTYCRYKMLAVKAALMRNPNSAAAAESISAEMPALSLRKSMEQLKDLESNSIKPVSISESFYLSSPTPKIEPTFRNKEDDTLDASISVMSVEFLQQMKKRHQEILNQKTLPEEELMHKNVSSPEVSMFPVIRKTDSPTQYDMGLKPSHLTPSVIEQFFTSVCPANTEKKSQTLDKKCSTEKGNDCPWNEHSEPHLHCIIKGCKTVTPNNFLDISAHIRMHGYNRDLYATSISGAATSPTPNSNKSMQITTIDGFFNRKRGRPPKNRFVEVYKNAQQSPQAIFTSFKLEKQVAGKESLDPALTPAQQPCFDTSACLTGQQNKQQREEASLHLFLSPPPTSSQIIVCNQNENCNVTGTRCPLTMQQHYHCASEPDCSFVALERDLLRTHLERQHTSISNADTISKKFKRFDPDIGLYCGIIGCRLRKTRPHLHCRKCYRQISPFDIETHNCGEMLVQTDIPKNDQQSSPSTAGGKNTSRLPPVTFSTLNELRRKVSEMEPECGSSYVKRSHEDEKVVVVRAAGTYFPEKKAPHSKSPSPAQQRQPGTTESLQSSAPIPTHAIYCSTPFCKNALHPHDHCDTCDQAFVDPVKWRAHRLKHLQESNQPIPFHLSHFLEPEESKPEIAIGSSANCNDEQPQDLSVSPNTTITPTTLLDERIKIYRDSFPTSPPVALPPQGNPTPGHLLNYFSQDLMSSVSLQNFHLAQLATLYQQNPYYYQHLYPFLSNSIALNRQHPQNRPPGQTYETTDNEDKRMYLPPSTEGLKSQPTKSVIPGLHPGSSEHIPFLNPFIMVRSPIDRPQSKAPQMISSKPSGVLMSSASAPKFEATKPHKRKLTNDNEEFSTLIDALLPSTKKQVQFAAALAAPAASNPHPSQIGCLTSSSTRSIHDQQHFKLRDEQIPNGYLKFRFNEDCFFQKCGYRNHQSHFHCDRNDCHYSFCDKTRFVQHTARHERLDKLMGNDFRQYRANMSCGYENCAYFKNLGSTNKSSHFHCLKCEFICSDTNKVVAHRRQHNKMEYIRMAGFRKVTNSEKCDSTFETTVATSGNELPGTAECSYSQKQTHYHCLVCDVSVLSKAQLSSHKHKT